MNLNRIKYKKPIQTIYWIGFLFIVIVSCSSDDRSDRGCLTCTGETNMPFELCEDADGKATVNGASTQTDFQIYLQNLQNDGVSCD